MAKYIDAEKLKAEIEKRQKYSHAIGDNAINSNMRNFYEGQEDCCKQLISSITSLQQEQPEVNLEKAAEDFAHFYDQGTCDVIAQECFIAGANWQKQQMQNE